MARRGGDQFFDRVSFLHFCLTNNHFTAVGAALRGRPSVRISLSPDKRATEGRPYRIALGETILSSKLGRPRRAAPTMAPYNP
jgi:hypothetical protein